MEIKIFIIFHFKAGCGAEAQSVTVKSTGCVSIPTRGSIIIIIIYIFISSLWCRGKARRWVPPVSTQYPQNTAESGERSVLTLGSLCLPCCVQDTAWSWFIYFLNIKHYKLDMSCFQLASSAGVYKDGDAAVQVTPEAPPDRADIDDLFKEVIYHCST